MKEKTFAFRGFLAGVCISIGGVIYLKVGGVAGAVLFAFGLIAVVTLGLNLFTGKAQFVWGVSKPNVLPDGRIVNPMSAQLEQGGYIWLFTILALNILGCIAMGALMGDADIQGAAASVIDKRLANAPWRSGLLAVGCGFIMTLAVQGAAKGKWLPLLFGIPAFILCGFPHCIADAFYIAALPTGYAAGHAEGLALFYPVIVAGNFIGCNLYRFLSSFRSAASGAPVA